MSGGVNRLAIIGAGPSGLIALKFAKEYLPDWEIVCFEKGAKPGGSWAKTHPDFVSTSTKYTTQFSCFQLFDIEPDQTKENFFLHNEYGDYLDAFTQHFELDKQIRLGHQVMSAQVLEQGQWSLELRDVEQGRDRTEEFTHVIICSGLANKLKHLDSSTPFVRHYDELDSLKQKKIVVLGGGESAVDIADRLSKKDRQNKVFLSLRSGIRVSPRIHPIKGVPSDFLRNRLMLSIHENIRNSLGQGFVEFRIKFERLLGKLFPGKKKLDLATASLQDRKAHWSLKINRAAQGKLFNMFHNKSDDFLNSIAEGRISVVGPANDTDYQSFLTFDQESEINVEPDLVVNATGFDSELSSMTNGTYPLEDFYLGCIHKENESIYSVGFARPIIGNIPTIAEMQARYVVGMIAGVFKRPENIANLHQNSAKKRRKQYPRIALERVYPVDMFPYCDHLAKAMRIYPKVGEGFGVVKWWRFWLAPASTSQYPIPALSEVSKELDRSSSKIYTPTLLVVLLSFIKIFDIPYRLLKGNDR